MLPPVEPLLRPPVPALEGVDGVAGVEVVAEGTHSTCPMVSSFSFTPGLRSASSSVEMPKLSAIF